MYSMVCANYANHLSNSPLRKMVVFSSPLLTNTAYCVAEMYIQTTLNGKIFPRCWLHSDCKKIYSSQLVSASNIKVTRKKWVCSCPNILSLLASKMINQLVWETNEEIYFVRHVKQLPFKKRKPLDPPISSQDLQNEEHLFLLRQGNETIEVVRKTWEKLTLPI